MREFIHQFFQSTFIQALLRDVLLIFSDLLRNLAANITQGVAAHYTWHAVPPT